MIEIRHLITRLQKEAVAMRYREHEVAWEIAQGIYLPADGELLPEVLADSARYKAWERIKRQVRMRGPRIMEAKRSAVLGDITWGTPKSRVDEAELDDALKELDLFELLAEPLDAYMIDGITALMAYEDADTGEVVIRRLGGYLEPYRDPRDKSKIDGLYQTQQYLTNDGRLAWWVRVYDFADPGRAVIREWDELGSPTDLALMPSRVIGRRADGGEGDGPAPIPRFRVRQSTNEGHVLGEILVSIPDFRALWATEARLIAAEEMEALAMLYTKGQWDIPTIGPGAVMAGPTDGEVGWLGSSAVLNELREQYKLRERSLNEGLNMPAGHLGANASGVAIEESNRIFLNVSKSYAADLSGMTTEVVEDYAELVGIEAAPVTVIPSRHFDAKARVDFLKVAYDELGAMPFAVLAREIQALVGDHYSDEELRAFVDRRDSLITPQDALSALGGLNE